MDVGHGPGSVKYYCSFPSITVLDRGADYLQYVMSSLSCPLPPSLPVKPAALALETEN